MANYWLSPTGQVIEVKLGEHYSEALNICEKRYKDECVRRGLVECPKDMFIWDGYDSPMSPVQFLEDEKNWIRYEDWGNNGWIIYKQRPTKKQIDRMFELTGYFYDK